MIIKKIFMRFTVVLATALAIFLSNRQAEAQTKPWLFTYIADWNWGNPMTYGQVDWSHYDVIIDFAVAPAHNSAGFPYGTLDTSGGLSVAQRDSVVARAHSQGKKIILSITQYPCTYWDSCTTAGRISGYCQAISQYVKRSWAPYDGIDVDWEFPMIYGNDSTQFKNFLDSIRVYLPSPTYLVTVTSAQYAPYRLYGEKQNDIDMVNIMTYDGDGVSSGWPSWFMGPVYGANLIGKAELSCDDPVDSFEVNGVPASKLSISTEFGGDLMKGGTTTDSMGITIASNGITAPGEMWTAQPSGKYDIPYYGYKDAPGTGIFEYWYNTKNFPNVTYHWNSTYQGSFLSNDSAGTTHDWELSFDDTNDINAKFTYVESKGLGGYFFYELGMAYNHSTGTFPMQSIIDAAETNIFGRPYNPPPPPPPPVKDTITVAITSPANGSTISGTVIVSAKASDNVGVVTGVTFKVDATQIGSTVTTAPYSVSLNTASLKDSSHTISAVATDAAGNSKTASITITTSNYSIPPSSSITIITPAVDFGTTAVDSTKVDTVKITNTSLIPLQIDSLFTRTTRFAVTSTHGTVANAETLIVKITFTPDTSKAYSDTLYIISNASIPMTKVPLSGNGAPQILVSPSAVAFGLFPANLGLTKTDTFRITNSSLAPLIIDSVYTGTRWFAVASAHDTVTEADTMRLPVLFTPDTSKAYSDTLYILSNASVPLTKVPLSGKGTITAVSQNESGVPKSYGISQNYPNPFNPTTVINYQLPVSSYVILKVYDILGREVATLVNGWQNAGYYNATLNAVNLPSGVYIYRLQFASGQISKKMVILK